MNDEALQVIYKSVVLQKRPVHGGVLQVLLIVIALKLLSVAVCGVVFTVLTVLQRLNLSVTVMTIFFKTL